jgi:hypothetical protein
MTGNDNDKFSKLERILLRLALLALLVINLLKVIGPEIVSLKSYINGRQAVITIRSETGQPPAHTDIYSNLSP